jgi:hypothetical protein
LQSTSRITLKSLVISQSLSYFIERLLLETQSETPIMNRKYNI